MNAAPPTPFRFTREQYHRLGEVGFLREDSHVELISGELIVMSPIGLKHAAALRILGRIFNRVLGDQCVVDYQNPLALNENSEPQPDVLLLGLEFTKPVRVPLPSDVKLLVEIAESSLGFDRGVKLQLYAQAGIPEVWIVNLLENIIERYVEPQGSVYQAARHFRKGESISVQAFPNVDFAVEDLLP